MQQAIYNNLNSNVSPFQTALILTVAPASKARTLRHLARKWDLYGVLTLMVSCAAYGVFALAHVA